jgi:succinyl-diaminopimelate desuccinylase
MSIDYKKLLKPYEQESIETLQKFIQVNSVYDESTSTKEKPFGNGVYNALDFVARLGEKEGFNVDRCDNYCTEISFGEGKLISIYAHADVVPVSGKWDYEPFGGQIDNNIMYGRGTSDDKGPGIAAFFAFKALKDAGLIKGYKVSLVFGGDEERGGSCLDHYFNVLKKPYPKYGFTPDAEFPLIYGEKGISRYVHSIALNLPGVISIEGGFVVNAVIDEAKCVLEHNDNLSRACATFFALSDTKYTLNSTGSHDELVVIGKTSHGSLPENGINAGLHLLKFLAWYKKNETLNRLADGYLETTGKKFGCFYEGRYLHTTTFNVGIMKFEKGVLEMKVDFRHPENCDPHVVENKLNCLGLGKVEFSGYGEYLLVDPNSKMVQTLLKTYQEESGDYDTPMMTIGGGTYAKESKNTIAFGSAFPGRNDKIHSPNEEIHLEDFLTSQSIYARAINELGNLDE